MLQKSLKSFLDFKESFLKQKRLKKEELKQMYLNTKEKQKEKKCHKININNENNINGKNELNKIKEKDMVQLEFSNGDIIKEEIKILTKFPNSVLSACINGKRNLPKRNGHYFLDRNLKDFKLLLYYIKKSKLPKFQNFLEEKNFFKELEFWGIPIKVSSKKRLEFDITMTSSCLKMDKTNTILTKNNNLKGIAVLNYSLKATSPFIEFTVYLNNSLCKNKKIFLGLVDKKKFEMKHINKSFEDKSVPFIFYWDIYGNKIVKKRNNGEISSIGFEKECICFLNMNELKIGMEYNQLNRSIKLFRNDIELGIEIQNINPGYSPAIELYMEECKIKLSPNKYFQESFFL